MLILSLKILKTPSFCEDFLAGPKSKLKPKCSLKFEEAR